MRSSFGWLGRALGGIATVVLAVVVVLGLFGLGFSGGVGDNYTELVDPNAPTAFPLLITGVSGNTITLESGDGDELTRQGNWGLEYPDGYGQIGSIVSETDVSVTRTFTAIEGETPVTGMVARLDASHWRGTPDAVATSFAEVTYSTEIGEYPAWLTTGPADTWLIVVHDRAAELSEGFRLIEPADSAGMRTMLITYRNDRDAPRAPTGRYEWGKSEWRDLEGAVIYATSNGASQVVLAGYGMGGSTVLAFLKNSLLADAAVGAILDSPIVDLEATVAHDLSQDQLGGAFDMPDAVNVSTRLIAGWRFDIDWGDVDYGNEPAQIPMLIFHGEDDLTTPVAESRAYASANSDLVKLIVTEDAGFTESWNVDPDAYNAAVVSFLSSL